LHDYAATPLGLEELRHLSQVLSEAGQSLVRRYDPLFLALQLDDRFITDEDFWTGIAEHPALINGPVLQQSGRTRICRSAGDVRAFLSNSAKIVQNPKSLSPRIAAMLKGETVPDAPAPANSNDHATPRQQKSTLQPLPKPARVTAVTVAKKPKQKAKVTAGAAKPEKRKTLAKKAVKPVKKAKKPSKK
jgi:arsenate reductase-like glutaredoxin family protein